MRSRTQKFLVSALVLAALSLVGCFIAKHHSSYRSVAKPAFQSEAKAGHADVILTDYNPPAASSTEGFPLRLNPETGLASINGHVLTAAAILPPGSFNQDISSETCEFFRARAINRELILQAAKTAGIGLNESQQQQLARLQNVRQQSGPGFVQNLNGGPEELSFEMRDAEAFMLQTSLMQNSGVSPNVTSQQVLDYYRQHASQFGELPATDPSRQEAWSKIDFTIRETLASSVRSDFQTKLAEYMKSLKSAADIELTPLASLAGHP